MKSISLLCTAALATGSPDFITDNSSCPNIDGFCNNSADKPDYKANFISLLDDCTRISEADDLMGYTDYGKMVINSSNPEASYSYYAERFGPCIEAYLSYSAEKKPRAHLPRLR